MSKIWDMTAAAVSFVFGLGVIAGVVVTLSGGGIYATLFGSAATDAASQPCSSAAASEISRVPGLESPARSTRLAASYASVPPR